MSGRPRIITCRPGWSGAAKFLNLPLAPVRPSGILGLAIVALFLTPSCTFLCGAVGQAPDAWTVEHFRLAREAERQSDFSKAAGEYQLIISHNPRFAGAYLNLGLIYHQQERYAEAVKVLQTAVTLDPNLMGAQFMLGVDDYLRGDFQAALPHLRQALQLKPTDRESAFYLGLTYIALEQPLQAARTLRAAAEQYPDDLEIAYQLGLAYLEAIRVESARVNRMGTESALSHWALGIAAEEKNERVAAMTEYLKALALDPSLADLYSRLAVTLQQSGFSDLALIALERYEVLRPEDRGVRVAVEGTLQESGVDQVVLTGIREAFLQLIKTIPAPRYDPSTPALADSFVNHAVGLRLSSSADPKFRAAVRLYFQGNYADAVAAIADSRIRSTDWIAAYLWASANSKNSEFAAAELVLEDRLQPYWDQPSVCLLAIEIQRRLAYAYLDRVMAKQPESVPAMILLAKSYVAAGRDHEALKTYQDVLKLAPNHFGIHLAIGQIYENGLQWPPAIEEFREELDLDPANAMALTHLAHALTEAREPAQAIPILEKLLATNPTDGDAYADLGKNLEGQGQREKAIEAYERAVTYDPTQFNLHYKLFQLYLKQGKNERAQKELAAFKAAEAKKQNTYRQGIVDLK
jgi:tetratricopeptide (TPR) repeat protein